MLMVRVAKKAVGLIARDPKYLGVMSMVLELGFRDGLGFRVWGWFRV